MRTIGGAIITLLDSIFHLSTKSLFFIVPLIWGIFGAMGTGLIKWIWGAVVPILLPGAVAQGLVVREMPWSAAEVLMLSIVLFNIIMDNGSNNDRNRKPLRSE